jgi:hypothetical protein
MSKTVDDGGRHARRLADPLPQILDSEVKRFLQAGKQTAITDEVRRFAMGFKCEGPALVSEIMKSLAGFERVPHTDDEMHKAYSKRTADDIIRSRQVSVSRNLINDIRGPVQGCVDYNLALCATLRARGIPAKFVRLDVHSVTHYYMDKGWHEANILDGFEGGLKKPRTPSVKPVDATLGRYCARMKAKGAYAEGLDAWDIGIRSLRDFERYEG